MPKAPYLRVIFISLCSQNAEVTTRGDRNETLHIFNVFLIVFGIPEHNTVLGTIRSGVRINHSVGTIAPLGMETGKARKWGGKKKKDWLVRGRKITLFLFSKLSTAKKIDPIGNI